MDLVVLRRRLRQLTRPLELSEILLLLRELRLVPSELGCYAHFGRDRYVRNPVQVGEVYELLLLCWLPGQASPFHDHSGSSCGVRVVRGVATETPVRRGKRGVLLREPDREAGVGELLGSHDRDIHRMANLGDDRLMTLHFYSPPLSAMRVYRVEDDGHPDSWDFMPPAH